MVILQNSESLKNIAYFKILKILNVVINKLLLVENKENHFLSS